MPRKHQSRPSGRTVLVVDDNTEMRESTRLLLEAEGHEVFTAGGGHEALEILGRERVHVLLVDYFMPWMTGEEVVRRVRESDELIQIVLVTGYAGEKPARLMMKSLDIQGYHDKGEGAERLLLRVDAALRSYEAVTAYARQRRGMQQILAAAAGMHRLQPVDALVRILLGELAALLQAQEAFPAEPAAPGPVDGFVATPAPGETGGPLVIRHATGRFAGLGSMQLLPEADRARVEEAIATKKISLFEEATVIPLRIADRLLGVLYLERPVGAEWDRELLEVFCYQAVTSLQNVLLYDLATTDPITRAHTANFLREQLRRTLRRARRRGAPLSLVLVELEGHAELGRVRGAAAAERAQVAVADLLREEARDVDMVGRWGQSGFLVLLPDTEAWGAEVLARRVLSRGAEVLDGGREGGAPRLSIGISAVAPGAAGTVAHEGSIEEAADEIVSAARDALADARRRASRIAIVEIGQPEALAES